MNENVIEFLNNAQIATVTFSQGRYISKVKKMIEKFPDEAEIIRENPDGSIVAHIPVKWVKISNRTSNMTEEQREQASERMKTLIKQRKI